MTQLPTPEEYEYIRMVAEQHLENAHQVSNQDLEVRIEFPPEAGDENWAFRVVVSETDIDPRERQKWVSEGTETEMRQKVDAQQ